jgi:hypothetical protein
MDQHVLFHSQAVTFPYVVNWLSPLVYTEAEHNFVSRDYPAIWNFDVETSIRDSLRS